MVLRPGGPCVVLVKDKQSGQLVPCGKVSDHAFYAGPTCKACYEKAHRKNNKRKVPETATGVPIDPEDMLEEQSEILVEIDSIYAVRCAMPRVELEHPPLNTEHCPVCRPAPLIQAA